MDSADDNNTFTPRPRYRAPYQFSNEVIKEFRVSSNGYSAELGRAVFKVVTNSGGNHWQGTGFLCVRDRTFDAQSLYVSSQPGEQQCQFGGTLSGPLVKNRVFLYLGYDQHQLTVPEIVQFGNRASRCCSRDRSTSGYLSARATLSPRPLTTAPTRWWLGFRATCRMLMRRQPRWQHLQRSPPRCGAECLRRPRQLHH